MRSAAGAYFKVSCEPARFVALLSEEEQVEGTSDEAAASALVHGS
jgi:hypothetical protein